MRRALLLAAAVLVLAGPARAAAAADCVVLLHGLARGAASMLILQEALKVEGFATVNSDYDSAAGTIAELAATAIPEAVAACPADAPRIHFVTHSMGAILLRAWLGDHALHRLGRTVMLAPPNAGSEVVDALADIGPFDWINGPAGRELRTDGLPSRLGPVWPGVGIIAGSRSLNPVYSAILPGADDGKVSVAATRVAGMAAHLTMPVTHTFVMNSPLVLGQVLSFLRTGRFQADLDLLDVLETFVD